MRALSTILILAMLCPCLSPGMQTQAYALAPQVKEETYTAMEEVAEELAGQDDFPDVDALKVPGSKLLLSDVRTLAAKEGQWREAARKNGVYWPVKWKFPNKEGIPEAITGQILVLLVRDLPPNVLAWHFRLEKGNPQSPLVVITSSGFQEEMAYHEVCGMELRRQGFSPHQAHVLSSAMQVLQFAKPGTLTPLHENVLRGLGPKEWVNIIRDFQSGRRASRHHALLRKQEKRLAAVFGKDAMQKVLAYEKSLYRKSVYLLLQRNPEEAMKIFPGRDNAARIAKALKRMSLAQREWLMHRIRSVYGYGSDKSENLQHILSGWFDVDQLAAALAMKRAAIEERAREGDLKAFVEIGDGKKSRWYAPERATAEYIEYLENKGRIVARRQWKAHVRDLQTRAPKRFRALSAFIKDQCGVQAKTPEDMEAVTDHLYAGIAPLAENMKVDRQTAERFVARRHVECFDVSLIPGHKSLVFSRRIYQIYRKEAAKLLRKAENWYHDEFELHIQLPEVSDYLDWWTLEQVQEIFPFVKLGRMIVLARKGKIPAFKGGIRDLVKVAYRVPPLGVERLKNEVVASLKEKHIFSMLQKYGLLPAKMDPKQLDYEMAKAAMLKIKKTWMPISEYRKASGLKSRHAVMDRIKAGQIDSIGLSFLGDQKVHYIPGEQAKTPDEEALKKGRAFLQDVCNVHVSSLDQVRPLLEQHCMTSSQMAEFLDVPDLGKRANRADTAVLKFTDNAIGQRYWPKKVATSFLLEQQEKFEALKEQISPFSDVRHIQTIGDLMMFLKAHWRDTDQLAKDLKVTPDAVKSALARGVLFGVIPDFPGYALKYYCPMSIGNITTVQRLGDFNVHVKQMEHVFSGFFSQMIMNMPMQLLTQRLDYLRQILPKYLKLGMYGLTGIWQPVTPEEVAAYEKWRPDLNKYIGQYLAKGLYLKAPKDVKKTVMQLIDIMEEMETILKSEKLNNVEKTEYKMLKDVFGEIMKTLQATSMVRAQLEEVSTPRDHQAYCIGRALIERNLLLADATRSGKSYEALWISVLAGANIAALKTLIVCTNTAMGTWREEIKKHLGGGFQTVIIDANKKEPVALQLERARAMGARYVLVNYETCRNHIQRLKALNADVTIIDEAHHFGRARGKHALRDAIFQLDSKYKIALSATPIRNKHPEESWPFLHWLYPKDIGSFANFRREFGGGTLGFLKLKVRLRNIMARFTRDEVDPDGARHDLIERTIPMPAIQAGMYLRRLQGIQEWYDQSFGAGTKARKLSSYQAQSALQKISQLRTAACFARLQKGTEIVLQAAQDPSDIVQIGMAHVGEKVEVGGQPFVVRHSKGKGYSLKNKKGDTQLSSQSFFLANGKPYMVYENVPEIVSNKLDELIRQLIPPEKLASYHKGASLLSLMPKDRKVVIFTESLQILHLIRSLDPGIKFIYGKVKRVDRDRIRKEFNEGPGPQIVVATRKTEGQSVAYPKVTEIYEMDYPYTVHGRDQAIDRGLGKEQALPKLPVMSLVSEHSIDEAFLELLRVKKDISDALLDEDDLDTRDVLDGLMNKVRLYNEKAQARKEENWEDAMKGLTRTASDWRKVEDVVGAAGLECMEYPAKQLKRHLNQQETNQLIAMFRDKKNGAALDTLVKFNQGLVGSYISKTIRKRPHLSPFQDELKGPGIMGLMRAITGFKPAKGFRLTTYAPAWIKQHVDRHIQDTYDTIRLPVHLHGKLGKLFQARRAYVRAYREEPKGHADLIAFDPLLGITALQYDKLIKVLAESGARMQSLDEIAPWGEDGTRHDTVADKREKSPEFLAIQREWPDILDMALARLLKHGRLQKKSPKHQYKDICVIAMRLGYDFEKRELVKPTSLEYAGQKMGVTRERVRQIQIKILPLFVEILVKMGIDMGHFEDDVDLRGPLRRPVSVGSTVLEQAA